MKILFIKVKTLLLSINICVYLITTMIIFTCSEYINNTVLMFFTNKSKDRKKLIKSDNTLKVYCNVDEDTKLLKSDPNRITAEM